MRKEVDVTEDLSKVTLSGRSGTVRYWAVVGADVSSSETVWTEMLYALPVTGNANSLEEYNFYYFKKSNNLFLRTLKIK